MNDDDAPPSAEEIAEAEALAQVLEDKPAHAPKDALEAVAFIQQPEARVLPSEMQERVLTRALAAQARSRRWRVVRLVAVPFAAAAAAVFLLMRGDPKALHLPTAPAALVQAQISVAQGRDLEAVEAAMGDYRREVLHAMAKRYGGEGLR